MKPEGALADVELRRGGRRLRVEALVDTGASRISKSLSEQLGSFIPSERAYELRTADGEGRLKIVGHCIAGVVFQGVEAPGEVVFEVAENLRKDVELIIGRPEVDAWDIIFTPEGPRPRKVPIEFQII